MKNFKKKILIIAVLSAFKFCNVNGQNKTTNVIPVAKSEAASLKTNGLQVNATAPAALDAKVNYKTWSLSRNYVNALLSGNWYDDLTGTHLNGSKTMVEPNHGELPTITSSLPRETGRGPLSQISNTATGEGDFTEIWGYMYVPQFTTSLKVRINSARENLSTLYLPIKNGTITPNLSDLVEVSRVKLDRNVILKEQTEFTMPSNSGGQYIPFGMAVSNGYAASEGYVQWAIDGGNWVSNTDISVGSTGCGLVTCTSPSVPAIMNNVSSVCSEQIFGLSASCDCGQVEWSTDNLFTTVIPTSNYNTQSITANKDYYVRCNGVSCGFSGASVGVLMAVSVSSPPDALTIQESSQPTCQGSPGSISVGSYNNSNTYLFTPAGPMINLNQVIVATPGSYSVVAKNATGCLSSPTNFTVNAPVNPVLSSNALEICNNTTTDISNVTSSNIPFNTILEWHTAIPASSANLVPDLKKVGVGVYYALFYDTYNDCYSQKSTNAAITSNIFTISGKTCCKAGTMEPVLH